MKRTFLLIVVALLSISGIKAQTPLEMNDKLAVVTDSLYARGKAWGAAFNDAYKTGNYTSLKPFSSSMIGFINNKISYITNMSDVKNSKPIRIAMLDLLGFEKKMVQEGFIPFEAFTASTPTADVQKAIEVLTERAKDEDAYLKKVIDAQQTYAKENGFTIEEAKAE